MLKNCRLYVIIDKALVKNRDILKITAEALRGGADIIQLRDKLSNDEDFLRCAKAIRVITKKYNRPFIINDRAGIARTVNADGVHLGQDDTSIEEARKIVGKKMIGVSTHNLSQAEYAQKKGADYIGIGPIFKTTTKKGALPIGLSVLTEVHKIMAIPFFAIGNISSSNVEDVKKNGAKRVAVASSAIKAEDVYHAVKQFKAVLKK